MRQFDHYEFTGIIVPGTTLLVAGAICIPDVRALTIESELSIGEASVALIISYGLGHLLQAVGNLVGKGWWWFWGGMPTDWPRKGKRSYLAPEQTKQIDAALKSQGIILDREFNSLTVTGSYAIVRQIYAAVNSAGRSRRVDIFNGGYGLNRGLAASLLITMVMIILTKDPIPWSVVLLTTIGVVIAIYRMHCFGVHYARELFVELLQLPSRTDTRERNGPQKE